MTPSERFWSKVDKSAGSDACWTWTAAQAGGGYGTFRIDGRNTPAHRWSYQDRFGPIPDGLDLDHLCRNRACVNPAHLEPVERGENTRRGVAAQRRAEWAARRTHCNRGHEYAGANLGHKSNGYRYCRECDRITKAARKKRSRPT